MKKRVCMLIDWFYPVIGGSEIQAFRLSQRLVEKGIRLFVLTRKIYAQLKTFEHLGQIPVHRVNPTGFNRYANYLGELIMGMQLIKKRKDYDIIHIHGAGNLAAIAVLVSNILKKKCIVKIANSGDIKGIPFEGIKASLLIILLKKFFFPLRCCLLKKADALICISKDIHEELCTWKVSEENIKFIPNGVDAESFSPLSDHGKLKLRKKLGLPPDKIILIFVGRLVYRKNPYLLLEALMKIIKKRSNIILLIVGSGKNQFDSCEKKLKKFVNENHLRPWVIFTGNVKNTNEYLQVSDIFVMPSKREGLSNVLIEAMSCGLPPIVSKIGGNLDIIRDNVNGIMVEANNCDQWVKKILYLSDHKEHADRIGDKARETIKCFYSLDYIVEKYVNLYSSLTTNSF